MILACDGIHSQTRESIGLSAEQKNIGKAYIRGVAEFRVEESKIRRFGVRNV